MHAGQRNIGIHTSFYRIKFLASGFEMKALELYEYNRLAGDFVNTASRREHYVYENALPLYRWPMGYASSQEG